MNSEDNFCEYSGLPSPSAYKTYSIPIYENGVKTTWVVDGTVGDQKYQQLLELGDGINLPTQINTNTTNTNTPTENEIQ